MHQCSTVVINQTFIPTYCGRHMVKSLYSISLLVLTLLAADFVHAAETLTLAHVGSDNGAIGRGGDRFAQNLEQVSNGEMTVKVIPKGALGGIGDIWAQMQTGAVDMQVIDLPAISILKPAKSMQVAMLPYLFESQEHFRNFAESELRAKMTTEIREKTGIRYLGIVEDRSPRIISTTGRVVKSVEDVAGLKIRVPGHPMFIKVFKSWGAIPTPINPSEMFMALKSGMVEAEDNGIVHLVDTSNKEVIKSVTPINWNRSGVAAWIAESRWKQFSDQQRTWISEAIAISERDSKRVFEQRMKEASEKLTTMGIVMQPANIESFKAAMKGFHQQFENVWPAGTVQAIKAMAD